MWELPPPQPGQDDTTSLHRKLSTSHCDTVSQMVDDSPPEQSDAGSPSSDSLVPHPDTSNDLAQGPPPVCGDAADHCAEAPSFNHDAHLRQLLRAQDDGLSGLASVWKDIGDFFYSRYGATYVSNEQDISKASTWSMRLGMKGPPPTSIVELYSCFIQGSWPPGMCDLSPDLNDSSQPFNRSPNPVLHVSRISSPESHLITVACERDVRWKLLIRDPLTLLQIEREGWDGDPHTLIINLIKKGIPFQVLNPGRLEDAQFYDHPGPVVHPVGRDPQYVDYLAYRQELGAFFAHYPHAYAAALSAGGILWRIAMDVLPLPHESDITRRFHPNGCVSLTINGEKYWSPRLTLLEENLIAGVYKWAVCKSTRDSSSETPHS